MMRESRPPTRLGFLPQAGALVLALANDLRVAAGPSELSPRRVAWDRAVLIKAQ